MLTSDHVGHFLKESDLSLLVDFQLFLQIPTSYIYWILDLEGILEVIKCNSLIFQERNEGEAQIVQLFKVTQLLSSWARSESPKVRGVQCSFITLFCENDPPSFIHSTWSSFLGQTLTSWKGSTGSCTEAWRCVLSGKIWAQGPTWLNPTGFFYDSYKN